MQGRGEHGLAGALPSHTQPRGLRPERRGTRGLKQKSMPGFDCENTTEHAHAHLCGKPGVQETQLPVLRQV